MRYALVLLLTLAACRGPMQRVEPELLPPLPRQIVSQLGPVPVVFVDSLTDEEGRRLAGGFHTMRRTIYIRREITSRQMQWFVLYHESAHVIMHDSGLDNLIPPALAQSIADAFASARVAEMLTQAKR